MRKTVKDQVWEIEVSSTEELKNGLKGILEHNKPKGMRLAALNVYGPGFLIQQFELPRLRSGGLRRALKLEAVELLRLNPNEVELDYQVSRSSGNKVQGFFVAAAKSVIREYISVCDKAGFIPLKIEPSVTAAVDAFVHGNKKEASDFCLLDFPNGSHLNLAVFEKSKCILLRQIQFDGDTEAEEEIISSLKYGCARSSHKQLENVYISGSFSGKDRLADLLKKEFNVKVSELNLDGTPRHISGDKGLFKLNLGGNYALGDVSRYKILRLLKAASLICLALCLILGIRIIRVHLLKNEARGFFNSTEYNRAKELAEKIRILKNAQ